MIFLYMAFALCVVFYWHTKFRDLPTTLIAGAVGLALAAACFYVPLYWSASDTEILSGSVAKMQRVYDPDTETYPCGTDSHGNTKTCTREVPRWRWDIISDYDDSFSEHTYQKIRAPEIYAATKIGDPYSSTKRFLNYQNVSEQSTMVDRASAAEYKGWLPVYPHVYAGFKVARGFSNSPFVDQRVLSRALSVAQKRWGPMHGVNVSVVILDFRTDYRGFYNAMASKWKGGKKNDAVLIIQLDEQGKPWRADAFSRSADERVDERGLNFTKLLHVDGLGSQALKNQLDVDALISSIDGSLKYFQREDLGRYDFLKDEYTPDWWMVVLSLIIMAVVISITVNKVCDSLDSRGGYRRMNRRFGMF